MYPDEAKFQERPEGAGQSETQRADSVQLKYVKVAVLRSFLGFRVSANFF